MPPLSLLAHTDQAGGLALSWLGIGFPALLYGVGARRLRGRGGIRDLVSSANLLAGWGGFAALAVALCSPLDAVADRELWAHMVQHVLIGLVAPLLFCVARPILVLGSVVDRPARRAVQHVANVPLRRWRGLRTSPLLGVGAVAAHVGTWWFWHTPVLFDLAVRHEPLHVLEHVSLFAAGVVLFAVCLEVRWADRGGLAILWLFGAAVGTGLLGALLTIGSTPLYAAPPAPAFSSHLSRLHDQQLAGAIMWVVGGAVYLLVAAVLTVGWLSLGPARHRDDLVRVRGVRPALRDLTR